MTSTTAPAPARSRWRTVDIVVAGVVAAAFGVVFFYWNQLWNVLEPAFVAFPPGRALIYGMWLLPGVLGGLIIRRPGAALFCELVAALISAALGSSLGLVVVLYGLGQGLGAELAFAATRYRRWGLPVALLAGGLAGLVPAIVDPIAYYPDFTAGWRIAWAAIVVASSMLIAGLGSWLLVRALAPTGVLAPFAAGRDQHLT
ncbi:MAG: ECF transporter S component [Sporichthyaceae bacterium]|jgi:energy-coupling factor transport system substrate-specific component|nr:ECF transporter S component [Sporichthyaceae bacterium]